MAITCEIVAQPGGEQGVVLSKNPFIVKVTSQDMFDVQGTLYSHEWEFEAGGYSGQALVIVYDGNTDALQIQAVVVDSLGILSYTESNCSSVNEWLIECVVPILNMHGILGRDFNWTVASNRLKATEKKIASIDYTITSMVMGDSITSLSEITGSASIMRNYKLVMQVACTKSMASGQYLFSEELLYDFTINEATNTGTVEVDISSVVDSLIDGWDNLSNIDANGYRLEVMQRRVYVSVKQKTDTNALYPVLKTKTVLVLKGGMRTNELVIGYLPWVGSNGVNPIGFITNKPKAVWCTKQTKLYLCWHNKWMDAGDTTLKAEVYYASGTSVADVVSTISNGTKGKYEVWSMLAGFNDLNLDTYSPGAAVVKYKIHVDCGDSAENIEQYFYLLPETDMGCTLVYRNALGVPDSIWCEGERTTNVVHGKELLSVARPMAPTAITATEVSYGRSIKPSITVVTAPMQRNEWNSALDVLLSDEVRIHFPQTDTWVVGQIEPGSVEETTVNWAGANMVAMRLTVRLNEEAGWSVRAF
jgi:hypothetical protein